MLYFYSTKLLRFLVDVHLSIFDFRCVIVRWVAEHFGLQDSGLRTRVLRIQGRFKDENHFQEIMHSRFLASELRRAKGLKTLLQKSPRNIENILITEDERDGCPECG